MHFVRYSSSSAAAHEGGTAHVGEDGSGNENFQ